MKMEIPPEYFTAHDRRDQKVIRYGLLTLIVLLGTYFFFAYMGWLPTAITPFYREITTATDGIENKALRPPEAQGVDRDPYLGIPFKGARFRIDFENGTAIVTRPDKYDPAYEGRTSWIIPETLIYEGQPYTVVALMANTLYEADGMLSVTLPATIRYFNGAQDFLPESIETIILQRTNGAPLTFTQATFSDYVEKHYPQPQPVDGGLL